LLKRELGFPLDRVAGNINRKMWKNMGEWFVERIKSACEFYLRYKDKPELLVKECSKYKEDAKQFIFNKKLNWYLKDQYNEWLFRLAFKGVLED